MRHIAWMGLALAVGCTGPGDGPPLDEPFAPTGDGRHEAGLWEGSLDVAERTVPVWVWYPSGGAPEALDLADLAVAGERDRIAALVDEAPADCPTTSIAASPGGAVADEPLPVLVMSHCHTCLASSGATIAAHLARHGWVVVAPEHTGNTLYDRLDDTDGPVDNATLQLRVDDGLAALDALVEGAIGPTSLRVDTDRMAAAGHSFGSMTAGRLLDARDELLAGVYVAAPPDNPLFQTADLDELARPSMFVVAQEDNSIFEVGNNLLRANAESAPTPSLALELVDAGHWSVSDIVALDPFLEPGCGEGTRQTDGTPFTYTDPAAARATTAAHVLAFLEATVSGREAASAWLAGEATEGTERTWRPGE